MSFQQNGFQHNAFQVGVASAAPSTSNSTIAFRIANAVVATALTFSAFPAFASYTYTEPAANPAIPLRQAALIRQAPELLVPSKYHAFPFQSQAAAQSTAPIPMRQAAWASSVPDPLVQPVPSKVLGFPRTALIPFLQPGTPFTSESKLVHPAYQAFPFQPAAVVEPANPVIQIRQAVVVVDVAGKLVAPTYYVFPFPSTAEAPASPIIPLRQVPRLEPLIDRMVGPAILPFPFVPAAPANPVLPIQLRRLDELQAPTKLVSPLYFGNIQRNDVQTPTNDRLYIDVDTGDIWMTLTPTGRLIIKVT